jgi:CheY-like chemotaxis protein
MEETMEPWHSQGELPAGSPETLTTTVETEPGMFLIIEENGDSRRMPEAMLKMYGYTVYTAADGNEGLETLLRLHPQLAIIDIGLPGLNG